MRLPATPQGRTQARALAAIAALSRDAKHGKTQRSSLNSQFGNIAAAAGGSPGGKSSEALPADDPLHKFMPAGDHWPAGKCGSFQASQHRRTNARFPKLSLGLSRRPAAVLCQHYDLL